MKQITVFGSNLSGIHGAGAARHAFEFLGAKWGQGEGLMGDCYALPTKGYHITFMSKIAVMFYVQRFLEFARAHPELQFKVTRIGCGLAGFKDAEIAPLFKDAPDNCLYDTIWKPIFENMGIEKKYWGTF